jgi:hypothetical protein
MEKCGQTRCRPGECAAIIGTDLQRHDLLPVCEQNRADLRGPRALRWWAIELVPAGRQHNFWGKNSHRRNTSAVAEIWVRCPTNKQGVLFGMKKFGLLVAAALAVPASAVAGGLSPGSACAGVYRTADEMAEFNSGTMKVEISSNTRGTVLMTRGPAAYTAGASPSSYSDHYDLIVTKLTDQEVTGYYQAATRIGLATVTVTLSWDGKQWKASLLRAGTNLPATGSFGCSQNGVKLTGP